MRLTKILSFILTFAMAAPLLCACGGSSSKKSDSTTAGTTADTAADTTEAAVGVPPEYTYKRVVLLGVDGAGNFFRDTDTPNMDKIFGSGATNYDVLTANPTISAECWGSMLIGSSASTHGLTNSVVSGQKYPTDSSLPSVFRRIREAYPDANIASICNWNPINNGIVEENLGVFQSTDGDDAVLTEQILTYLDENDPTFLFVQFDNVDGAGHGGGYGNEGHLAQITTTDGYIGQIHDKYTEKGWIEDTLFMVTADHGGTPGGSHGGLTDEEKYVFFGLAGKTVKAGTFGEMNIRDTAAIILLALGIELPEFDLNGFSGQVPKGIFEDYTPAARQPLAKEIVHETVPTPAAGSGKYITDFVDAEKLDVALFFDKNTDNAAGDTTVTVTGTPKYYDYGYYGSNIEVGKQGHLALSDFAFGRDNFTVSLWFYYDGAVSGDDEFILYSTSDWANGGKGLSMTHTAGTLTLRVSNGADTESFSYLIPESISKGWVNTTIVVDREAGTITHYYNFATPAENRVASGIIKRGDSFDSYDFTLGLDGAGVFEPTLNIMMDDFIIYRGAMSADEIASLASYYGIDG